MEGSGHPDGDATAWHPIKPLAGAPTSAAQGIGGLYKLKHWQPSHAAIWTAFWLGGVALAFVAWACRWWSVYGANYSQGMMRVPGPKHDDFEGGACACDGWDAECASSTCLRPPRERRDYSFEHVRGAAARAGAEYEQSVSGCSVLYAEAEALRNRSPTNTEANFGQMAFEPPMLGVTSAFPGAADVMYAPSSHYAHLMVGVPEAELLAQGTTVLTVEIAEVGGSLQLECAGVSEATEVQQRLHQLGCAILGPDAMPAVPEQIALSYVDAYGQWLALPTGGPELYTALSGGSLYASFLLEPPPALDSTAQALLNTQNPSPVREVSAHPVAQQSAFPAPALAPPPPAAHPPLPQRLPPPPSPHSAAPRAPHSLAGVDDLE